MMENKSKHTKTRCNFLNMNLTFERNHLEDDLKRKSLTEFSNPAKKFDHNSVLVF